MKVGQRKLHSLLETITSTLIGFVVALVSQLVIFHFYGIALSLSTNIEITLWFTFVSIVRGYFVRRWFNYLHTR